MKNKKVLIIEDNPDLQDILKTYLELENLEVRQSFNGLQGLIEMGKEKPDLVILDLMMPEMDGFEVLREVEKRKDLDMPIVVCSNIEESEYKKRVKSSKAKLFLEKSSYGLEGITNEVVSLLRKLSPNCSS